MRAILFFALIWNFSKANPAPQTNDGLVDQSDEPRSKIVFVSDLPPGETVTFNFERGAHVYVASASDEESQNYENNVHIFIPGQEDYNSKQMADHGKRVDDTGAKLSLFGASYPRISVRNTNSQKSNSRTPGIIYFVTADDETHTSKVYESGATKDYKITSDHINNQYVTMLNPTGAMQLSNVKDINGLTQLVVSAGGVHESESMENVINTINANEAHSTAKIFILEPVITLRKQLALAPSDFGFTATAAELHQDTIIVPLNWTDWSVAMSPDYMLKSQSRSIKFNFTGAEENTQYDLHILGELASTSTLTLSYDGYDGAYSETMSKKKFDHEWKNVKGQFLTVDYKRADDDSTGGFLIRVNCRQPAAIKLLYTVFMFVIGFYVL
ncbi:unnamed protein product [Caenorhabditis angaria]|uniref:CUB-like domain-containing protein n=1 Tax=Caenorhabditis angaria TaxID=860376 RepID=A0A9P1ILF4_9PELO|nr:unnamed protein product [Caenorhabditis angaria]